MNEREPFTITIPYVPDAETWEDYALRCTDIGNYAVQRSSHLSQPSTIYLSDTTKFRKVSETVYELIPSVSTSKNTAKERPMTVQPNERDIAAIIRVLKANIKNSHGNAFAPGVMFTKGEMQFLVELLEQHVHTEKAK